MFSSDTSTSNVSPGITSDDETLIAGLFIPTLPDSILKFKLYSFILTRSPFSYFSVTSLSPFFAVGRTRKTRVNKTPSDISFSEFENTTLLLSVNTIGPSKPVRSRLTSISSSTVLSYTGVSAPAAIPGLFFNDTSTSTVSPGKASGEDTVNVYGVSLKITAPDSTSNSIFSFLLLTIEPSSYVIAISVDFAPKVSITLNTYVTKRLFSELSSLPSDIHFRLLVLLYFKNIPLYP